MLRIVRVIRLLVKHPLGRLNKRQTLMRFLKWQVGSRILREPVAMPFVDDIRLLVRTGMHGATGNIYVGLMEFEDMSFVLHFTRPGNTFVDVGANVGVYSLLAASRGAQALAIEPVPRTYESLLNNINLNRFQDRIEASNIGVAGGPDALPFSTNEDATNHVLVGTNDRNSATVVEVKSLDSAVGGRNPTMIKIDVEGFEAEVIRGARAVLSNPNLQAVLLELNGLGARYGLHDNETDTQMRDFGFKPSKYDPFTRTLTTVKFRNETGNTLYVRGEASDLTERLKTGRAFKCQKLTI